jgi:hypothetical protein
VQRAHQIAVMERGQITARGTHEELLRTSPLYQHLHEIQFQLQAEEPVGAGAAVGERQPALAGASSGRDGRAGANGAINPGENGRWSELGKPGDGRATAAFTREAR